MFKKFLCLFILTIMIFINLHPAVITYADNFNIDFEPACESILLVNLDSDCVIFDKNSSKRMHPASLTKIMTYIIVAESVADFENTTVTVKDELIKGLSGTGSSLSGIKSGETLSILQLLHCLMIKSGNDAAVVLADFVGNGNIDAFVQKMNDKAGELGCEDTHFVNPHGLHDEDHYTTARDLLKITKYAMTLPNFVEITSKVTSYILGEKRYPLVTTNSLIDPVRGGKYYCKYVKGIKTGSDSLAGKCLVSSAVNNGYTYICIAMGGFLPDENCAMTDSKALYKWVFKNLALKLIINKDKPIGEVKVKLSLKKDSVQLLPSGNYSAMLPKGVVASSIDIKVDKPEFINAPIKMGQKVGTATLSYANTAIATIDLVAAEDVGRNGFLFAVYVIQSIVSSIWFKVTLIVVLLLIGIYAFIFIKYNKRNRKRRKSTKSKRYKYR